MQGWGVAGPGAVPPRPRGARGGGGGGAARKGSPGGRSARLIVASSALKMERPCLERDALPTGCAARGQMPSPRRSGWPERAPGPERACAWADKGGAEGGGGCPVALKVTVALFPNSLQVTFPFLTPFRCYSSSKPGMYLGRRLHPLSPRNLVPIVSR